MKEIEYKPSLSVLDLLLIAFIVLKLTKVIDWSWWLVLSPLYIRAVAILITLIVIVIIALKRKK